MNERPPEPGIHPTAVVGDPPEHRDRPYNFTGFYPLIAASARINAFVTVDAGMNRPTRIGARSFLMTKSHVGHDASVGADCEIAPLVSIGGECEIGDNVRIGQGAVLKPRVKVGTGAQIGAGAVVTTDVPAGQVWVGNPARYLREREP
ncbi:MAG: hypothetical protein HY323_05470 [Betaproteobacteria bacterium]|nr:hypothetical protein [Betaproteobacteria bacterium]